VFGLLRLNSVDATPTDNAVTQYRSLAAAPDTDTGSLIGLLTVYRPPLLAITDIH
jgi:4-amino-4-deoxy-L-arabinose transferase-like glycosyltransferase